MCLSPRPVRPLPLAFVLLLQAAATRASEPDPVRLDPVVVTGTRRATPLADTPVAVLVITRDDIVQSQARTAAEVLDGLTGLVVTRSFRGEGVELQGLSGRHVLVLLDGERVSGKVGEELDLSRYSAESIERIEIVRGAGSALYGSDAMAGVINIVTRKARRRAEASLDLLVGSAHRAEIASTGSARTGALGTALSLSFRRQDAFDLDATPATTGSSFEDLASTLRFDLRVSDALRVDLRAQHLYREQGAIDATPLPPDLDGNPRFRLIDRKERTNRLDLRLAPELRTGDHTLGLSLSTSLSWSTLLEDQRGGTSYDRRQDTFESATGATLQWSATLDRHALTAGVEASLEHLDSQRLTSPTADRRRLGVFLQDEWRPLDPASPLVLALVPGLRLDVDSQFGATLTPRLALRFDPSPAWTLRTSFGLGYRAPGFRELYLVFDNPSVGYRVAGNPDLRPERSRSVDLSVELRPSDTWSITLLGFRHDLTDLIVTLPPIDTPGEPSLYTYDNVSTATSQGLELRLAADPLATLRLELGWSFTDSRDDETGFRISGRATHQGSAHITWRPQLGTRRLTLTARAHVLAPRPFDLTDDLGLAVRRESPWLAMVDARAAFDLAPHLALVVGVENLLDAGDPTFAPLRPRNLYLGLSGRY
jgi:outer membrane receptor for ferrienterochelin and colicins